MCSYTLCFDCWKIARMLMRLLLYYPQILVKASLAEQFTGNTWSLSFNEQGTQSERPRRPWHYDIAIPGWSRMLVCGWIQHSLPASLQEMLSGSQSCFTVISYGQLSFLTALILRAQGYQRANCRPHIGGVTAGNIQIPLVTEFRGLMCRNSSPEMHLDCFRL